MDKFSSSLAAASLVDGQHFTLPGYGTLEGVYVSAQINHVKREVSPPSLDVTWTTPPIPGAQTFAELLVNTGATTAEAVGTQDAWLDALERGERVAVGDLGYVALDDATNLVCWVSNAEALAGAYWSSGAVPVEPLATSGTPADTAAPLVGAAVAKTAAAPVTLASDDSETAAALAGDREKSSGGPVKLLRYAALFALVLIGLAFLRGAFSDADDDVDGAKAVTISNDRLNRSPLDGTGAEPTVLDDGYEEPAFDAELGPGGSGEGFDPANLAGESPTPVQPDPPFATAPPEEPAEKNYDDYGGGAYVVILGSFGQASNAQRLTQKLVADGHLPYVDQKNGLTRVGLTVDTEGVRGELTRALSELRLKYGAGAWVLE